MSNPDERSNTLWKSSLGFPLTNKSSEFFLETEMQYNNYVDGKDIFMDTIPASEFPDSGGTTTVYTIPRPNGTDVVNTSRTEPTGIVEKFEHLPLTLIPKSNDDGTSGAWYCKDDQGNNLLADAIQMNYNQTSEIQPYLYRLFFNGTDAPDEIYPKDGKWVFFVNFGAVKFFSTYGGIDANSDLYITFYRYVGRKGVSNINVNNISGNLSVSGNITGTGKLAVGNTVKADGAYSTAMGGNTTADGHYSTAMGYQTKAYGKYSVAEGANTTADGDYSTAMGYKTTASGDYSFASGFVTRSPGDYSTTLGSNTKASGNYSTAMGSFTTSSGGYSTTMGRSTQATGSRSTAMGEHTKASGHYSTAMGYWTSASGSISTAMGDHTTASGSASTALGEYSLASGISGCAMGSYATASGNHSTALGDYSLASGQAAFAAGWSTTATGEMSTALGRATTASGDYSTALGRTTEATERASLVCGTYNKSYGSDGTTTLFEVGNGTYDDERSNCFEVAEAGQNQFFSIWNGKRKAANCHEGGLGFAWSNHSGYDKNLDFYMRANHGYWHKIGYFENSYYGNNNLDFTGQHRCLTNKNIDEKMYGLIVSSTGTYVNIQNTLSPTVNESLPICEISTKTNDKKVFGVISDRPDDDEERNEGYGVFRTTQVKTNRNEKRMHINSVGEGGIWVCDIVKPIENGDYITSSIVPGYGQLQSDDLLHNYSVAKITCDCDFSLEKVVKKKLKVKKFMAEKKELEKQFPDKEEKEEKQDIVYDSMGNIEYEDDLNEDGEKQFVYPLDTRFLNENGQQLKDETEYKTRKDNGEKVFIACFVGCTYHCG
tara:strand:+ start:42 stop:2528 length:2487 start_codon:yes stop_codon:yes gene_type:complete